MLELISNLVWFSIALLGFSALWSARHSPAVKRRPVLTIVAMFCAIVLLFPVISATDDLHTAAFAFEEPAGKSLKGSNSGPLTAAAQFLHPRHSLHTCNLRLDRYAILQFPLSVRLDHVSFTRAVPDRAPPDYI
jgi:hypothetical protein